MFCCMRASGLMVLLVLWIFHQIIHSFIRTFILFQCAPPQQYSRERAGARLTKYLTIYLTLS